MLSSNPRAADIVAAYQAGDPVAISLIDTAVQVAHVTSRLRDDQELVESQTGLEHYEIRSECDMALDDLVLLFDTASQRGWMAQLPLDGDI